MRIIRLFKRNIIKDVEDWPILIEFNYNVYKKEYYIDNCKIMIINFKRNKQHGCTKYIYSTNYFVYYKKYIHNMLLIDFSVNKSFTHSHEYYFVKQCLIKSIDKIRNLSIYLDYEYEQTEYYKWNPKIKNSIMNNIRNSKLYQFIRNIISK